jgi:hypothetical protein
MQAKDRVLNGIEFFGAFGTVGGINTCEKRGNS